MKIHNAPSNAIFVKNPFFIIYIFEQNSSAKLYFFVTQATFKHRLHGKIVVYLWHSPTKPIEFNYMRKIFITLLFLISAPLLFGQGKASKNQTLTLKGTVLSQSDGQPIEMATVTVAQFGLWATTDAKGAFAINRVPAGNMTIAISCLGFQTQEMVVNVTKEAFLTIKLKEDNLTLQTVTVTAQENKNSATTSRKLEKQAIEHLQVVNATDIMSLLPGGQTARPSLTEASIFSLRGDNAGGFGTAVVLDGIRMNGNGSLGSSAQGVDSRFIAASNIESVEVVTGVPSVEYGDMTAGMVIINTKKGRTPYTATVSLNSTTKQFSVNKGFELGGDRGIINFNVEYAKAFKDPASRYTTFYRNNYGLNYIKTFNKKKTPVSLDLTLAGGWAKQNQKNDPDAWRGTWHKEYQNNARFGAKVKWLINAPWLTSLEFNGSASYADASVKDNSYWSYASIAPAYTAKENGYFETDYLPVKYYYLEQDDSKYLDFAAGVKANWNRKWGILNNHVKLGLSWTNSSNVGDGITFTTEDAQSGAKQHGLSRSSDRERPYSDIPALNNYAAYLEEVANFEIGKTTLSAVAGVRAERVSVKDMSYKHPNAVSPRFNIKWSFLREKRSGFLRQLALRGAWGELTKLPSLGILYPVDNYRDLLVYSKNTGSDVFYAANTQVYKVLNNERLKWAKNRNIEVGFEANLGGIKISAVYFNNKSKNGYTLDGDYVAYPYAKTDEAFAVPGNAKFRVDKATGDIFVSDKDNPALGETLIPKEILDTTFVKNSFASNKQPFKTQGVEMTIDFGTIKPLRTSVLFDARYTFNKNIDERLQESYSTSQHPTAPKRSYPYVGYYVGSTSNYISYNGEKRDNVRANLTFVTHIPEIRLTVSTRIEAEFFNRYTNLTYYNGKEWAFLKDDNGNKINGSVYHQKEYRTGVWPVAYKTFDGVVRPFTAKEAADPKFADLVGQSNTKTAYWTNGTGPYLCANISITKEIGSIASISFYANNCTNSIRVAKYWATGLKTARRAAFSYGATLRLKF